MVWYRGNSAKSNLFHNSINFLSPTKLTNPSAVAIDRSVSLNRPYVVDTFNNRVLGYSDIETREVGVLHAVTSEALGDSRWHGRAYGASATDECREPIVAGVFNQTPSGFHQPLLQAGERPVGDRCRQREPPPQITQIVGNYLSHGRTSLARKRWQLSRVIATACLPSLINCSAVPRLLYKRTTAQLEVWKWSP